MTDKTNYMPAITNTYRTSDLAQLLAISAANVRRHAAAIEAEGAAIARDERGERIFSEQDLAALRHMRKLVGKGQTLADAGKAAAGLLTQERQARADAGEVVKAADREVFMAMVQKLDEQDKLLRAVLDDNEYLRGQIGRMLAGQQRIETLMEEKAAEPAPVQAEEKPDTKRPWWRLFG